MSLDIQQQLFKMNADFWPQARGPPSNGGNANNAFQQALMDATSNDFQSRVFNNNNNNNNNNENNNVEMKDHLMQGDQSHHNNNNNNSYQQAFALQAQPPAPSPGAENSSPEAKFNTEKLVSEIQQLSRSNNTPAINERTLEECWSTLQRIFMHKSAIQMQHARDIQRNGGNNNTGPNGEVKPHQCQQCLKSFSSNHQLVQHIRVHTGEKPYKCTYCDRRFKQLSHVQQHTRLHTGERPYKCHLPDCGRAFIQLSNLQQHLRNHDAQVERAKNRPFHCNICGKGFATESSLRTHTSKELQLHLGVLQQHAALIGGPNATSCLICHKLFLGGEALMEHMKHHHKQEPPQPTVVPTPPAPEPPLSPNDQFAKQQRRIANHPCPVCGKSYVNEGSLRKHLACHPETSQIANSLRMWPCSVCQAVFTHEAGLLTHMEHMRMDPKHQFAAQYMLSRAAAERRERDSILAAAVAGGSGLLQQIAQNSRGASPAHSEASSCNERMSSPSHPDTAGGHNENNQNNANSSSHGGENNSDNNNNTSGTPTNLSTGLGGYGKMSVNDVLRSPPGQQHLHQQYQQLVSAAAANIVAQNQNNCNGLNSPVNPATSAAQAVANLAAAMRQQNGNQQNSPPYGHQNGSQMGQQQQSHHHHHHHHQQQQQSQSQAHHNHESDTAMRIHQAEALLRSQAEAALRLAVSQAAAVVASNSAGGGENGSGGQFRHHNGMPYAHNQHQQHPHHHHQSNANQLQSQFSPDLSEALRLQEQRLEQALRLHSSELSLHQQHHQQQQQP